MFWHLTKKQEALLRQHLGNTVIDLGAGDGSLAVKCLSLGAESVVAVEPKQEPSQKKHPGLTWVHQYFREMEAIPAEIAVISWPWEGNETQALIRLAQSAQTIICLAKTTDGSYCGCPELWEALSKLEVAAVTPDKKNTLVIYRNLPRTKKGVLKLEEAGMDALKIKNYSPKAWATQTP